MKRGLTELVFIIDRSGSMYGLESDTVGGFNSMLHQQRSLPGTTYVSTILFDDDITVIHDRQSIDSIRNMTSEDYRPGGCTALMDAVGSTIQHIANAHKYARNSDVPENTLFVIITDGMENASRNYNKNEVYNMIRRQKEKYGWEFLFLGANIDAVHIASGFGIEKNRASYYRNDGKGTRLNYDVINATVSCIRSCNKIPDNWNEKIEEYLKTK